MQVDDDFRFEPIPGLPERPPEGEEILWQGRPSTWQLAWEALSVKWVVIYFAVVTIWRIGASTVDFPMAEAIGHGVPLLVAAALVIAILWVIALMQARGAVYTLTTHRVAMRVGAALQMTLNLPYTQIANATLAVNRNGTGTIALDLKGETRISYLLTWPHVRRWRMARTEPALRCIPDAARVAGLLAEAAETRVSNASSIKVSAGRTADALPAE